MASNNDDDSPVRLSRNRKSRGRGLRTTTGWYVLVPLSTSVDDGETVVLTKAAQFDLSQATSKMRRSKAGLWTV